MDESIETYEATASGTDPNQDSPEVSTPTDHFEDLIEDRCIACNDNNECEGGLCVNGLCADATGAHPGLCVSCHGDDECTDNNFCHGTNRVGRSGKVCTEKRANGASCGRNEACQSGHCNLLFRCESSIPEHLRRDPASASASKRNGESRYSGLSIWASFIGALFLFGSCAAVLCNKHGLRRFCGNSAGLSSEDDDTLESHGNHGKFDDDEADKNSHTDSTVEDHDDHSS